MLPIRHCKRRSLLTLALIALTYFATHVVVSRMSAPKVANAWGIPDAFLYLPIRPEIVASNPWCYSGHLLLYGFFYPAWQIDRRVFGGPSPMWSLPLQKLSTTPPKLLYYSNPENAYEVREGEEYRFPRR